MELQVTAWKGYHNLIIIKNHGDIYHYDNMI